jgi:mono/diheme cytochrome c family protein
MAGWNNALTPEEINAMLTLIQRWGEVSLGAIPAPDVPVPTTEESIALGGELYSANCSRCHGPDGQGTPRAPSLNVKSFWVDTTDQAIQQIVTLGVPGTAMPAWGDRMTDAEIQAIVGFLRQWETTAPEVAQPMGPPSGVGGPPWLRNQAQPTATPEVQPDVPNTLVEPKPLSGGEAAQAVVVQPTPTAITATQHQPVTDAGHTGQGGGPAWAQEQTQTPITDALDWRMLALIAGGLSLAFTLIAIGFSSLRRASQGPPST